MNKEWLLKTWPVGSKKRALGGKTALEALREKLGQNHSPKGCSLESLNDDDLALVVTGMIVKSMHQLGVKRATRETNRELNSGIPSHEEHLRIQSQKPGNL